MGSRMIRDQSGNSKWWLMIGLFTLCVTGWSLAFSFKAAASTPVVATQSVASEASEEADRRWPVDNFNRISVSGSFDITLIQGAHRRVTGKGEARDLDRLEILVESGELIVRNKPSGWFGSFRRGQVELQIEFETLERLSISGSSDVRAGALQSPQLSVVVSGSGDLDIDALSGEALDVQVSGSADIEIGGAVAMQRVGISGSADYEARDLQSKTASVRVSGSGDVELAVSESLNATVQGSGSVRYEGDPEVQSTVSGSGDIRPYR